VRRWETPKAPDPKGEQLRVLKEHLRAHPKISRVWIEYSVLRLQPLDGRLVADDRVCVAQLVLHAAGRAQCHGPRRI
jgi:hypothetical protein